MTPEREAYLVKCSNREMWLRRAIVATKRDISYQKQRITITKKLKWQGVTGAECELWHKKQLLMTLRHELARLKGMDRVVVPREVEIHLKIVRMGMQNVAIGICKCGERLESIEHLYCPACGKRILWEKVK